MKVEKVVARRISFRSAAVERAPADLLPRRQVIWKIGNYRSSATIQASVDTSDVKIPGIRPLHTLIDQPSGR
ncbi:MAG: hypothetical protein JWN43_3353 [Gammaproteobacteria bacterium]|nr:hypothetical protein [Gammaproteobacteria bacterium]